MNRAKLKQAESNFLSRYPLGFEDPGMQDVAKRHRMGAMVDFAQTHFAPGNESHAEQFAANLVKCVSRSSMVSMFEKPKFRDFVARLDQHETAYLVDCVVQFLHGDQARGLESMVDLLAREKLAKWSLVTIVGAYFSPLEEVFVKPTTAKGVIRFFEVDDLHYKPRPSWEFYRDYRALIHEMKAEVDPRLSPSNAAFSGFLMMSL